MTKQETILLMMTLRAAYPRFYADQGDLDAEAAVKLWQTMFAEDDAQLVSAAVKAFIATDSKGFPPSIGQIKDKMDKIMQEAYGRELTPVEAWALVAKAAKRSYYNAQEEFDKLPDTVRAVLGGASALHDYAQMDPATLNSVVASNFQRSFAARRDHVVEMRKWPTEIKAFIASEQFKAIGAWPKDDSKALPAANGSNVLTSTR